MELIKKFTPIQIYTKTVNDRVNIKLTYGEIEGPYYSQEEPDEEFDSEDEAIEYAYKKDKHANWLIVPRISFCN